MVNPQNFFFFFCYTENGINNWRYGVNPNVSGFKKGNDNAVFSDIYILLSPF